MGATIVDITGKTFGRVQVIGCIGGKPTHLGSYDTFEEACAAREEAELKYYGFTKE